MKTYLVTLIGFAIGFCGAWWFTKRYGIKWQMLVSWRFWQVIVKELPSILKCLGLLCLLFPILFISQFLLLPRTLWRLVKLPFHETPRWMLILVNVGLGLGWLVCLLGVPWYWRVENYGMSVGLATMMCVISLAVMGVNVQVKKDWVINHLPDLLLVSYLLVILVTVPLSIRSGETLDAVNHGLAGLALTAIYLAVRRQR